VIEPLDDRVLIRRIEEPSAIVLTDAPKGIKGVVLSVGPGKWHPGDWEHCGGSWVADGNGIHHKIGGKWEWVEGWREAISVKPGDTVLFNSRWNDFSAGEFKGTGADGAGPLERPLPLWHDPLVHLVRDADVLAIIPHPELCKGQAYMLKSTLEQEFFVNRAVSGPWSQA